MAGGRAGAGAPAPTPVATSEELRRARLATLLRLVHVEGPLRRSDLAARTGLNRSTVRALTTDLAGAGLVRETVPRGGGYAGRPSIVVMPESQRIYALALEVGVEYLVAARIGIGGVLLDRLSVPHPRARHDVAALLERVAGLLAAVRAGAPPEARCVGLGVGVCGVVRSADGLVRFAPNLGWVDVPLGRLLAERMGAGLAVAVRNEADLGARAEHVRGVAVGRSDIVYLSGEVGLGGGLILNGRPLTGTGGYAGEVGHMVVNPRGRSCRCGRRGCWETEVGEDAILLATRAAPGTELAEVLLAAAENAAWTRAGIRRVGRWLGVGIANLVNMLNPEVIIFGGVTRGLFPATEPVIRAVLQDALAAPRAQVVLTLPALGADSVVFGAAELVFDRVLEAPLDDPGPAAALDPPRPRRAAARAGSGSRAGRPAGAEPAARAGAAPLPAEARTPAALARPRGRRLAVSEPRAEPPGAAGPGSQRAGRTRAPRQALRPGAGQPRAPNAAADPGADPEPEPAAPPASPPPHPQIVPTDPGGSC